MYIKDDYSFEDLKKQVWSGAVDTIERIEKEEKEEEFMELLQAIFENDIPTLTAVNDLLWFDDDFIYRELGIENED